MSHQQITSDFDTIIYYKISQAALSYFSQFCKVVLNAPLRWRGNDKQIIIRSNYLLETSSKQSLKTVSDIFVLQM